MFNCTFVVPEGGTSQLLFFHCQEAFEVSHFSNQHCILVLTLYDEVLQALGHVQLAFGYLFDSQAKLCQLLSMLVYGLQIVMQ